jgi:hypothetical protein
MRTTNIGQEADCHFRDGYRHLIPDGELPSIRGADGSPRLGRDDCFQPPGTMDPPDLSITLALRVHKSEVDRSEPVAQERSWLADINDCSGCAE